jgi:hypothetical protein
MMKWKTRSLWIFVFLCSRLWAGNPETIIADSLFRSGSWANAALEYERVVFNSKDSSLIQYALMQKGFCYKAQQNFSEAFYAFKRVPKPGLPDFLLSRLYYETVVSGYLAGNIYAAQIALTELDYYVKDSIAKKETLFLHVLVLTELERWEEAAVKFEEYARYRNFKSDTVELVRRAEDLELKSPDKAGYLSLIIPGLGQTYAGKPWRGLSSLLITGGLTAFTVIGFQQGFIFSPVFTGIGLFLRFYAGGARYAHKLAEEKNKMTILSYKKEIRDLVLRIESGSNTK